MLFRSELASVGCPAASVREGGARADSSGAVGRGRGRGRGAGRGRGRGRGRLRKEPPVVAKQVTFPGFALMILDLLVFKIHLVYLVLFLSYVGHNFETLMLNVFVYCMAWWREGGGRPWSR